MGFFENICDACTYCIVVSFSAANADVEAPVTNIAANAVVLINLQLFIFVFLPFIRETYQIVLHIRVENIISLQKSLENSK